MIHLVLGGGGAAVIRPLSVRSLSAPFADLNMKDDEEAEGGPSLAGQRAARVFRRPN